MHKTLNISLIAVILLAIVVCAVLYFNISSLQGPFMFDEAFHAIESLKLARDIQTFDLFALARHASTQIWYPFMHSLISAFFLCIFSETMIVAILPSLVCLFLSAIMVYFLSYEICENKNRATLASIISVVMVLGSPALLFYSTTVVLELMAMALVLINLLVFFKA